MGSTAKRSRRVRRAAAVLALALVAAACGGGDDDGGGGGATGGDAGTPTPGGKVVYGLEAETIDGWCLPEAQLAISGIMVTDAIYDTLTRPNAEGVVEPWLAESVEANADSTVWTIKIREGVKFHDGSDLTAEVVKNNLDAYRGTYPTRKPLLFVFVLEPIQSVDVLDPLTVQVTMKQPWVSFDAQLYSSGRLGIMAQAQLDDTASCAENLIGTGPFKKVDWVPNQSFTAEKNPDYWATDAAGNQLPYLDEIEFRPVPEVQQRLNALESGDLNAMHTSEPETVSELRDRAESGEVNAYESEEFGEVGYLMLNVTHPPFDNITARQAVAYASNFDELNAILGDGILTQATGPFAPGNIGNLDDTGLPQFDLDKAKSLVEQYKEETGQDLAFTYSTTNVQFTTELAQLFKQQAEAAGMSVDIVQVDQSTLIDTAIQGDFQAMSWRNHPGGDPDQQYNWWKSGSPVNFGKFSDPEIDRLLDEGRTTKDGRDQIYEDLNKRFAEQLYDLWTYYTPWVVATATDVHGVPGEGPNAAEPFPGLATGHLVAYMWVEQ
ncbi:MAG TPA: ABC transporter substrate-binding protein [Acidimicrobiales bacterium]|nr:ABC transporter substrate-binding protein [Acidimicrobiales bacterium]